MLIVALIILQLLIFGVLIFFFRKIMTQNMAQATHHLDELSQDYHKKEQEVEKQMQEARQKAEDIINVAKEEAEKLRLQILHDTESEKERIISEARTRSEDMIKQADNTRHLLLSELDERIAKEATGKACEVLQLALPDEFKEVVHSRWVEGLIENGFSQIERLHVSKDLKEVKIISAFTLKESERNKLSKKIKEFIGHEISIKEEIDPKICSGLIIHFGSLVLDGSLNNMIKERAKG